MTVAELIQRLSEYPSDRKVTVEHIDCDRTFWLNGESEVNDVREGSVTYGILTDSPTTYETVCLL